MAAFVPPTERIISIEDTAELNLPLKHWIRMEARPPGLEEKGEITLDILTKNALRMRPDRIIVGEVRHDEAFTLFTAMNTGHAGSMGTIHANSSQETIARVTSPPMSVPEIMLSGLDFIIVEQRLHSKKKGTIRRITEIAEVTDVLAGKARTQTLYEYDAPSDSMKRTTIPSNFMKELEIFTGMNRKQIEDELSERTAFLKKLAANNIRDIVAVSDACQKYLIEKKA
jgi:flagellar protein FlaI